MFFLIDFLLQFLKGASKLIERGKNIITAAIATLFNYFFKVLERKTTILSLKNTSKWLIFAVIKLEMLYFQADFFNFWL